MKTKQLALAALMVFSTFAFNAQAWTVTTQGIIGMGTDPTGIFGTAGANLSGLSFTQVITVGTDPTHWSNLESHGDYYINLSGTGPAFTNVVTVDGKTVTFTAASTTYGTQVLAKTSNSTYDVINQSVNGTMSDGTSLSFRQIAYKNQTPFVSNLSFDQTLSLSNSDPVYKESYFNAGSVNFSASGNFGRVDNFSVNPVSPVPEPATYLMMLSGLAVVGFAASRRKFLSATFA